ncbi:putative signal transducing protein [Bizionia paragorgiae]|jgi:DNA-directed RNA polymerase subunit RPC12/RpoP|uniref:putative signal transducing protein n=1 Tax=Bizionia paragorgiae TaxID=283786 RepID=UPI003A8E4923
MSDLFKTIARFQYSSEAQIIKGRLESEGIQVFLTDNLTIDTDPLVSNAIGGVKLKVYATQALEAQHILETIRKYAIDDEGDVITCPQCHSKRISKISTITDLKSFTSFLIGFLSGKLPFYAKDNYQCDNCHTVVDIH